MKFSVSTAVAVFAALASATGNDYNKWVSATGHDTPGNGGAVVCSPKMADALTFAACKNGQPIPDQSGVSMQGLTCQVDKPTSKARFLHLVRRGSSLFSRTGGGGGGGGGGNCARGNTASKPKISCAEGGDRQKFTVDTMHVKPEDEDTDMQFNYNMPGGKSCKEVTRCSKEGTDVKPKLCAGATDVQIGVPPNSKDCNFQISSVIWLCTTGTTGTTVTTATTDTTQTSSTTETTATSDTTSVVTQTTTPDTSTMTLTQTTPSTSVATTPPSTSTVTQPPSSPSSPSSPPTTPTDTVPVSVCSEGLTLISNMCMPVTSQQGTPTSTVQPPVVTTSQPSSMPPSSMPPSSMPPSSMPPSSMPPPPPPPSSSVVAVSPPAASPPAPCSTCQMPPINSCPMLVPQCLQTFLYMTKCQNNMDISCMCPQAAFAMGVFACIYGYGISADQIQQAVAGFQGLCATAIPSVPAYVNGPATYNQYAGLPAPLSPPSGSMNSVVATITTNTVQMNNGVPTTVPVTTTSTVMFPPISFSNNPQMSSAGQPTSSAAGLPSSPPSASSTCASGSSMSGAMCVATSAAGQANLMTSSASALQKPLVGATCLVAFIVGVFAF